MPPSIRSSVYLGLAGSITLAIAAGAPAQAQVQVTGGRAFIDGPTGARVFVPDSATNEANDDRTVVYEGTIQDGSLVIQTNQGPLPTGNNLIFRQSTLPTLNTPPGTVPDFGNTGTVQGTVSFRGFSAAGEPTFFNNIPTTLQFTLTGGSQTPFSEVVEFTEFRTPPTVLTEFGSTSTPSSFSVVQRDIPVVLVQYQPSPMGPEAQRGLSAETFSISRSGLSYEGTLGLDLTGGEIAIPASPGFSPNGTTGTTGRDDDTFSDFNSSTTFVGAFNFTQSYNIVSAFYSPVLNSPVLVVERNGGDDDGTDDDQDDGRQGGRERDRIYVDARTNTQYTIVGVPSRVFPGLCGLQVISSSDIDDADDVGDDVGDDTTNENSTQPSTTDDDADDIGDDVGDDTTDDNSTQPTSENDADDVGDDVGDDTTNENSTQPSTTNDSADDVGNDVGDDTTEDSTQPSTTDDSADDVSDDVGDDTTNENSTQPSTSTDDAADDSTDDNSTQSTTTDDVGDDVGDDNADDNSTQSSTTEEDADDIGDDTTDDNGTTPSTTSGGSSTTAPNIVQ